MVTARKMKVDKVPQLDAAKKKQSQKCQVREIMSDIFKNTV